MYKALLHLYPKSFRAEYEGEMCAVFAQRGRDASGPLGFAALWIETFFDVLFNALRVHLDILRQDLSYLGRTLRQSPGYALTVVGIAGLGIGATTAAFSITDHVLLRPLPFPDADRLVTVYEKEPRYSRTELSPGNYRDWKAQSKSFEAFGAYSSLNANLAGEGEPEALSGRGDDGGGPAAAWRETDARAMVHRGRRSAWCALHGAGELYACGRRGLGEPQTRSGKKSSWTPNPAR